MHELLPTPNRRRDGDGDPPTTPSPGERRGGRRGDGAARYYRIRGRGGRPSWALCRHRDVLCCSGSAGLLNSSAIVASIRWRLRLWVAAWLVCQVASLSALVPSLCCGDQRPASSDKKDSCHENVAATHCPMLAAEGTACPMHRGSHEDAGENASDRCSMRGTCDGPMAALSALLSNHGVLTDSFEILTDLHASSAAIHTRESLTNRLASPDPPPPRA